MPHSPQQGKDCKTEGGREILNKLYKQLGLSWRELTEEINKLGEGRLQFDQKFVQNVSYGRSMANEAFIQRLLAIQNREMAKYGTDLKSKALLESELKPIFSHKPFFDEISIKDSDIDFSIREYSGLYLHLAVDSDNYITVNWCLLADEKGLDGTPVFRLWRNTESGRRVTIGTYFSNGRQLFLFGSRKNFKDIRTSVFRVNPDSEVKVVPGFTTGVSYDDQVFTSRCSLFPISGVGNCINNINSQKVVNYAFIENHEKAVIVGKFCLEKINDIIRETKMNDKNSIDIAISYLCKNELIVPGMFLDAD